MWCNWSNQAAANDNNFTRAGMSVEEAAPYWGTGKAMHISVTLRVLTYSGPTQQGVTRSLQPNTSASCSSWKHSKYVAIIAYNFTVFEAPQYTKITEAWMANDPVKMYLTTTSYRAQTPEVHGWVNIHWITDLGLTLWKFKIVPVVN